MVAKYAHIDFLLIPQPIENCETVIVYAYVFKNLYFYLDFFTENSSNSYFFV